MNEKIQKVKEEVAQIHGFVTWGALIESGKITEEWRDEVSEMYHDNNSTLKDKEIESLKGVVEHYKKTMYEDAQRRADAEALLLYAFHPNGHGPYSFFVIAGSEEKARELVREKITKEDDKYAYDIELFNSEHYRLEVFNQGVVAVNEND